MEKIFFTHCNILNGSFSWNFTEDRVDNVYIWQYIMNLVMFICLWVLIQVWSYKTTKLFLLCLTQVHAQSCPTLCGPIDGSPPGSSVHGIFQARILKRVAISSFRGSSRPRDQSHISCVSCTGFFFTTVPPGKRYAAAAAAAKSLQSCLTLCDPRDGSPPGSLVPGILQARTLEWVAISFSNAWKWKVKVKSLSPVRLPATPWTPAYQAPPSVGFSRQEYWSGLPLPSWKCRLIYTYRKGINGQRVSKRVGWWVSRGMRILWLW